MSLKKGEVIFIFPRENTVSYSTYRQSSDAIAITDKTISTLSNNFEMFREPLGLESIAAYLRQRDLKVKIFFPLVEEIQDEEIIEYIRNHKPSFVGFSVLFDRHLEDALLLSAKIKQTGVGVPVFFGGALASFAAREILTVAPWIDGIVLGEGEQICYNLCEAIDKGDEWQQIKGICYRNQTGQIQTNPVADKINLEAVPPPARDFLDLLKAKNIHSRVATLYTSRGCPEPCTYCTGNQFSGLTRGKRWRSRTTEAIVDEIAYLYNTYNVNYIYICDDNFIGYGKGIKDRIKELVTGINDKNLNVTIHYECRVDAIDLELLQLLKKGGFKDILLGLEAGVQSMLDRWKKKVTVEQNKQAIRLVSQVGLNLQPGFILLDDRTTLEELKENILFIKEMKLHQSSHFFDLFNPIEVFNGSTLEKQYHRILKLQEIRPDRDEVKAFVKALCTYPYTIQDPRVRLFWEIIRPIIDRVDYYTNYKIFSAFIEAKRKKHKNLLTFIGLYKKWKNDIGEILLKTIFYALDRVEYNTTDKIKEEIDSYYKAIENGYFPDGIESILAKLND
jgi:anaerobic magnesium-protoporphyrin IX monomethyl ester cyclase